MFENITQLRRSCIDPKELAAFKFRYMTRDWVINNQRFHCDLLSSYAEAEVVCQDSTSCIATKVRRSQFSHPPQNWTMLDLNWKIVRDMFEQMIESINAKVGGPSLLDRYLDNPDSIFEEAIDSSAVGRNTTEIYSARMTHLLNSYFTILNGLYAITGGMKVRNKAVEVHEWNGTFVPPRNSQPDIDSANYREFFNDEIL